MDKLRELQLNLLELLKEFQTICRENDLSYFPIDGTLLGLIRHKGFIPWDDDVDIGMPRNDFEALVAILMDRLPDKMHYRYYKVMDDKAKDIQYGIRLYSNKAQVKSNFYGHEEIEDINIDIFPIDGMPDGKLRYEIHKAKLLIIKAITKLSQITYVRTFMKRPLLERILIQSGRIFRLDKVLNTKKWYARLDCQMKKYPYDMAKIVGVFWSDYRFHEMVPRICYEPAKMCEFEDIEMPCPAKPELILQQLYGEWQKPPKEGAKQKHPIEIYNSTWSIWGGVIHSLGFSTSFLPKAWWRLRFNGRATA